MEPLITIRNEQSGTVVTVCKSSLGFHITTSDGTDAVSTVYDTEDQALRYAIGMAMDTPRTSGQSG